VFVGALVVGSVLVTSCGDGGEAARSTNSSSPSEPAAEPDPAASDLAASDPSVASTEAPPQDDPGGVVSVLPDGGSDPAPGSSSGESPVVQIGPPSDDYPTQPEDVTWPTGGWTTGALPSGVDGAAIDAVVDTVFVGPDVEASARAVLVAHRGQLVYERYHPLTAPGALFPSFGVSKGVTAALVGIAQRDGLLDITAPVGLPEWSGDARAAITIEHLLQMRSGLEWEEGYGEGSDTAAMLASQRAAEVPISRPLVADPGTTFSYSTGSSAIITDVLAQRLGGPEALDTFIRTRLVEPLGMETVRVLTDERGVFVGGLGFDATARDIARFGLLHLRGGVWDGQRLLDEEWVDYVRTPSPTSPQYGAHWWLRVLPTSFLAQGLYGQQMLLVPELDLLVLVLSAPGGEPDAVIPAVVAQFTAAG